MKIEDHKRAVRESIEVIKESVQAGIEKRQRTIGFHCSAAVIDILEIFLHQQNAIDPGKVLKHDLFSSERKALDMLPEEFPEKKKIIDLLIKIENLRNLLCYGKPKPKEVISDYLNLFHTFCRIFDEQGVEYE